jgi:antitoxin component HigA of HigAB toxin-antitoxin module
MSQSRQWVVDLLRQMGYAQEADEAAQELPDPVDVEQLKEFGDRHGISRDELTNRMGGSP